MRLSPFLYLFLLLIIRALPLHAQTLIKHHFGVTSHLTVPLDKMDRIKTVRTYTSAGTFCKDPEEYMFEPTWQNFHYDDVLEDAKSRGMRFVICVTNSMPYYASGSTESKSIPVEFGADTEDPASYIMYGKLIFQIVARYGSKVVPDSLLKVKDYPVTDYRHQVKRSGTNLLYGIEIWNEANKWGGNFTPMQYYALLSACYDGHKGTLGDDVGAMQADPDMHFFFTGISDLSPSWAQSVRDIWVQERGEPFPENIIYNFHGYFHNKALNNNNRTMGIAPELGGALSVYQQWAAFAGNNKFAKTEYGYDTHPLSVQHAPLLNRPDTGTYDIQESQAGLVLRDYHLQSIFPQLILSTFYHVRDGSNGGSSIQYSTCGVTYGTCCNYAPKESYFIISGFIELSDGFYSNGTLLREDPYIVQYTNGSGKYLYALWAYSQNKFIITDMKAGDDTVKMIVATKNGNVYSNILPASDGGFEVTAGQIPAYLIADGPIILCNDTVCNDNLACTMDACALGKCIFNDTCCQSQSIALASGWNIISSYVIPDVPNMANVFENIAPKIALVKNNAGFSYIPSLNINTIGNWDYKQGYKVKTNAAATLTLGCTWANATTPISLNTGWNIVSYLRTTPMNIATALTSINSKIIIVKNNAGFTYIPSLGINTIGNIQPGQGYQIKLASPGILVYPP